MALWSPLQQWFGQLSSVAASGARPPIAPTRALDLPLPAGPSISAGVDPECRFIAMLLAVDEPRPMAAGPAERAVLQALEVCTAAQGDQGLVPRLPAALPRLMGLVRRDEVSARELAEQLARDPALLGEVMRIANSPRYRSAQTIASVQDAVLVLGQQGMNQLLIQAVMGPVFNLRQGRFSRSAGTLLWDQAERCAHACAWLRRADADPFDAYLAGMAANAGLMVALRLLDQADAQQPAPDSLGFHAGLGQAGARLSAVMARRWSFPDSVVQALELRAGAEPAAAADSLAAALCSADRLAKLHLLRTRRLALPGDAEALAPGREREAYRELERAFDGGSAD